MEAQPFPPWGTSGGPDFFADLLNGSDLLDGEGLDQAGLGDVGAFEELPYKTTVAASPWFLLDEERRNSHSTSSSNEQCSLEEPSGVQEGSARGGRRAGSQKPKAPLLLQVAQQNGFNRAREKNKAAQRAYRLRTKEKAQHNEQRIKELEEKLEELMRCNDTLQHRNSLLEATARLSLSSSSALTLKGGDSMVAVQRKLRPIDGWDEVRVLEGDLELTKLEEGRTVTISQDEIVSMTPDRLHCIWKAYTQKMAEALVIAQGREGNPATLEVKGLLDEMMAVGASVAMRNLKLKVTFMADKVHAATKEMVPPPDWAAIVRSLVLSEEQKDELLKFRRSFFAMLSTMYAERDRIKASITSGVPLANGGCGLGQPIPTDLLNATEACRRLAKNLEEQHHFSCMFMGKTMRQVMRPMQLATFIVSVYPHGPDMLSVIREIAKERGEELMPLETEHSSIGVLATLDHKLHELQKLHSICA